MFVRILFLAALALAPLMGAARAQDYPNRTVTITVGFTAGGPTDVVARILADQFSQQWRQPVVVENRLGASGTIAADMVAKSPPDGYRLMVSSPTNTAAAPGMFPNLPYNVVRDFVVASVIATTPFMLVVPSTSPLKTFDDFVRQAKATPAEMTFGSAGLGAQGHLAAELLNQSFNIKMMHVPYKGESAGIADLVAGRLSFMFVSLPVALPLVKAGNLRGLAVSSLKRTEFAMEYPTIAESGVPNYESESWNALYVPSGVPKDILARLNAAVVQAVKTPSAIEKFRQQGLTPIGNSSEQATAYLRSETEKWGAVIKAANFQQQ
jgi:tripartite-type tricarboxylate transporter receptor subunit TctC